NAEKEFGKFDRSSIETERQILEKYFAVNFAELETTELKLLTEIEAAGSFARSLHMVTPVGFYSMVCNDVSSRGYENGIEMNRYMIRLMRKLVRFYIDQTVYGEQPPKLVPFIKGEENIFQGQSRFPRLFAPGAVLNTCYLLLLILAAYVLFKRNLYPPCKRADNYADIDTPLESGINTCIDMEDADLYAQHMGVFYGLNTTFAGRLTLDGESRGGDWAKDFLMLPDAGLFTGNITVAEFIEQSASLGGLSAERQRELLDIFAQQRTLRLTDTETKDRARLLLELAQRHAGKIIILSDFTAGLGGRHYTELDEIVNKLKAGGRAIVQINHRSYQVFAGVDRFISWQLKDGKFVDIRRRH
ncbi:MAG: hypothetical protein GY765_15955, partial [bacterium]|nr:hypothetical protein [bacterium]